jgi:pyridoxal-dependent decarboxylase-like protein
VTLATAVGDVPHLLSLYRSAFRGIAIVCPAKELYSVPTAQWVRKHGLTVAAHSSTELTHALSVGIHPSRLVVYGDRAQWGPIRCAVNRGVHKFVIDSAEQVPILEHHPGRRRQVLVDVNAACADEIIDAVSESVRLDFVGLHCGLDVADATEAYRYAIAVDSMIARMAEVHARRGQIACRLSLAGPLAIPPEAAARIIDDAAESSCARHHFSRPSVTFTPRVPC